jgi:hypothetical protein
MLTQVVKLNFLRVSCQLRKPFSNGSMAIEQHLCQYIKELLFIGCL